MKHFNNNNNNNKAFVQVLQKELGGGGCSVFR